MLLKDIQFSAPQFFWLLPIALVFISFCYFYRRTNFFAYLLRLISVCLLILALCSPKTTSSSTTSKAVALFDTSRSVSLAAKKQLASSLLKYSKDSTAQIEAFTFAETLSSNSLTVEPNSSGEQLLNDLEDLSSGINSKKSNIYESLQSLALKTGSSAIFLFSDGWETQAEHQGASTFRIYPVVGEHELYLKKGVSISELIAATTIKAGDKTKIDVVLRNNSDQEQIETLAIKLDGDIIKSKQLKLSPNSQKRYSIKTSEIKGGKHKITAKIMGEESHRWVTAHEKSKILVLSGEEDDERVITSLIRLKGYKLESIVAGSKFPDEFSSYSSIVLNNVAKNQLPAGFLAKLKQFVAQGGGLLTLGGNRSYGLGGYIDSELEQISPLKFSPPQAEKKRLTNGIVLVLDKSGSMAEQDKIISAKKAALSSIESLKDEDYISVIGFDFAPFVVIDLQKVSIVKPQAENRLRNLTAVGKTNLLPALAAARQKLNNCPASRKHIIVLSDGKFPLESDLYVDEINKLREGGISVSAVALGVEADVPFMKILARYGKGAFYHTIDPTKLPEIFVEDIKVAGDENSLNEQSNYAVAIGPGGLTSTSVDKFRPLRGFVETLPKQGSTLELITKSKNQAFPILASWNFGSGKSIAFTSDANGRWSSPWLSWDKFSVFWGEIIQNIQPTEKQEDFDFDLRHKIEGGKLKLDLAVFDLSQESAISAEIITPQETKKVINFQQIAKGRYQAEIESPEEGDYFFNIKVAQTKLPEIGINVESVGEQPGQGINLEYLLKLASQSSAELNPIKLTGKELKQSESKPLHLPLIISALILLLLEAFIRESRTK